MTDDQADRQKLPNSTSFINGVGSARGSFLSKLSPEAKIAFLGVIVVGFVGALAAIIAASIGAKATIDAAQLARSTLPPVDDPLRLRTAKFTALENGAILGIPGLASVSPGVGGAQSAASPDTDSARIYKNHYQILYKNLDVVSLRSQLPPDVRELVPTNNLPSGRVDPKGTLSFELWNIDEINPVVVTNLTLTLQSFVPLTTPIEDFYIYLIPAMGGGGTDQAGVITKVLSTGISDATGIVDLLRAESSPTVIPPKGALFITLKSSFETPGKYYFKVEMGYHTPTSQQLMRELGKFEYAWTRVDTIDASKVKVIK